MLTNFTLKMQLYLDCIISFVIFCQTQTSFAQIWPSFQKLSTYSNWPYISKYNQCHIGEYPLYEPCHNIE